MHGMFFPTVSGYVARQRRWREEREREREREGGHAEPTLTLPRTLIRITETSTMRVLRSGSSPLLHLFWHYFVYAPEKLSRRPRWRGWRAPIPQRERLRAWPTSPRLSPANVSGFLSSVPVVRTANSLQPLSISCPSTCGILSRFSIFYLVRMSCIGTLPAPGQPLFTISSHVNNLPANI